jgi:hypothetical protein
VIYEHGDPWWNDMNKGKLLIRPPELSGNPTSRVNNQEQPGEVNDEFGHRSMFVHISKLFLRAVKSYDIGQATLLPSEGRRATDF